MTREQVEARIAIEKRITAKVVADVLAAGHAISVDDGDGSLVLQPSRDAQAIEAALMSMDADTIYVHRIEDEKVIQRAIGYVLFVYGNDGFDVIADNHIAITGLLKGAEDLADSIEAGR